MRPTPDEDSVSQASASRTSGDESHHGDSRLSQVLPQHVQEQVDLLMDLHSRTERRIGPHQRAIERVTEGLGQPRTIYLILATVTCWVFVNSLLHVYGARPVDPPPFPWLQGAIGLYAALASTVVMITQNRQNKHSEHRSYLELQVTLLSEQKAGKIISLIEELRRDLPAVRDRVDREAETMTRAVSPKAVLSAFEKNMGDLTIDKP